MATVTDVEVANASFPNVRQDLNDILEALATNFSADAEPTTTYPNQFWYETDTNLLYIRNEADDAWITLASINQTSGEWEPRTAIIQAIDSAGLALKTDDGTTRFSISDAGVVSFENYAFPSADGSANQVLTTDGSGTLTFEDSGAGDKIEEGNSSVEVVDTGTGKIEFTVDAVEVADFTASAVVFNESGANVDFRVEGDTEANLLFVDAGNDRVGIATNSPGTELDVNGDITADGIYLGGTGAANYLDDYEEGTWTPFWSSGVTSPTYLVQQGRYVKTGKQVIASCYLRSGTGTGNATHVHIGGLPFTVSNDATGVDGAFWSYNGGFYNSTSGSSWICDQNTTLAKFFRLTDGAALNGNASGVTVNSDVRLVMVYRTDS